jgi:hypothetical protein
LLHLRFLLAQLLFAAPPLVHSNGTIVICHRFSFSGIMVATPPFLIGPAHVLFATANVAEWID